MSIDAFCPHCDDNLELYEHWAATDYRTSYTIKCKKCGKKIPIEVEAQPDFIVDKGEG